MGDNPVTIGITMGDAAGIGPEICLRLLVSREESITCRPVVFGSVGLLRRVAQACQLPFSANWLALDKFEKDGVPQGNNAWVVDVPGLDAGAVCRGVIQASCGTAAFRYVEAAVKAVRTKKLQALVTAPLHKEALRSGGIPYAGHTEMLAALTGTESYCMMMASASINVCLVSTHVSLASVSAQLTSGRVLEVIDLAWNAMRHLGVQNPRLTVCGLNPHAGEHGLFGDEEQRVIMPAVLKARARGMIISDPVPPDTAFLREGLSRTDVFVVMYHDQGLIPFKMLAFESGVNVTLGLPLIRTSVDHGTAFDIAWQGVASESSLLEAVRLAVRLSAARPPDG